MNRQGKTVFLNREMVELPAGLNTDPLGGGGVNGVSVADEIIAARNCGIVRCGLSCCSSPSLAELAAEFGLSTDLAGYQEIDLDLARRLVELVLNQDMGHNVELVPAARAAELADRFLAQFGSEGLGYYTNYSLHEVPGPKLTWSGATWNPMTEATFDTGVLVVGPKCSGCLWVEDEDEN